jgi:hypothetical protein
MRAGHCVSIVGIPHFNPRQKSPNIDRAGPKNGLGTIGSTITRQKKKIRAQLEQENKRYWEKLNAYMALHLTPSLWTF